MKRHIQRRRTRQRRIKLAIGGRVSLNTSSRNYLAGKLARRQTFNRGGSVGRLANRSLLRGRSIATTYMRNKYRRRYGHGGLVKSNMNGALGNINIRINRTKYGTIITK